jgi:DNA-binding NarL/FixJ family response regulator
MLTRARPVPNRCIALVGDDAWRAEVGGALQPLRPGTNVVQAGATRQLDRVLVDHNPWLVVIDERLADADVDLPRRLQQAHRGIRFLVVGAARPSDGDVRGLKALRYGAHGFLALSTLGALPACVDVLARGEYWVQRKVVAGLVEALGWTTPGWTTPGRARPSVASGLATFSRLTPREREVCLRVAGGASNKSVASELGISEQTVKHHLSSVYAKTGLSGRVSVALAASAAFATSAS